jgi:hypothetical protein
MNHAYDICRPARENERSAGVRGQEQGIAVVITLITLSVLSLLGLYMAMSATTEMHMSDNYESRIRASYAGQAGLGHARELFRGLDLDDQLNGPGGYVVRESSYVEAARTYAFRNPLTWVTARSLNIANPGTDLAGLPPEGVMNTGLYSGTSGSVLIPVTGNVFNNPNGLGLIIARYFVKVSDNNGEASELAGDPLNDPFRDGDRIVIVRAMGVAATLRDDSNGTVRRNSVAGFESRMKRSNTFNLDAPFVVEGDDILPSSSQMFAGNAFGIYGDADHAGIATIDTNTTNGINPSQQIRSQVAANQEDNIVGMGLTPSISDVTAAVSADPEKALLRNPSYLWNFATKTVPAAADSAWEGDQSWHGGNAPDLGFIDLNLPANDPSQRPRITYVNGDLNISGNITGGGVLVVTGKLSGSGSLQFNGLILVIGKGDVDGAGLNIGFNGGMFIARLNVSGPMICFDTPRFSWKGNSNLRINSKAIRMGMNLFPLVQLSWREITSIIDPQ